MASTESDSLRQIKSDLAKVRALRQVIRHAPDQGRRDSAIIEYSRTLDDMVDRLLEMDASGGLEPAPAAESVKHGHTR